MMKETHWPACSWMWEGTTLVGYSWEDEAESTCQGSMTYGESNGNIELFSCYKPKSRMFCVIQTKTLGLSSWKLENFKLFNVSAFSKQEFTQKSWNSDWFVPRTKAELACSWWYRTHSNLRNLNQKSCYPFGKSVVLVRWIECKGEAFAKESCSLFDLHKENCFVLSFLWKESFMVFNQVLICSAKVDEIK